MIPDQYSVRRSPPAGRSLRQQLRLGMLAVVTVVLVAVVPVLAGGYVTAGDAELVESRHALNHSYTRYRDSAQTSTTHPAASRCHKRCWVRLARTSLPCCTTAWW